MKAKRFSLSQGSFAVGLKLTLSYQQNKDLSGSYGASWARVEAVGYDWMVMRANNNEVLLVTDHGMTFDEWSEEDADD